MHGALAIRCSSPFALLHQCLLDCCQKQQQLPQPGSLLQQLMQTMQSTSAGTALRLPQLLLVLLPA